MFRSLASGWSKLDSFFSIRRVFFIWRCFSLSLSFRLFLFESSHFLAFLLPSVDLLYKTKYSTSESILFLFFFKRGHERPEGERGGEKTRHFRPQTSRTKKNTDIAFSTTSAFKRKKNIKTDDKGEVKQYTNNPSKLEVIQHK